MVPSEFLTLAQPTDVSPNEGLGELGAGAADVNQGGTDI